MNNDAPQNDQETLDVMLKIRTQIENKHSSLIRNAHLYLCYMHLITYNFVKSIYHGKILLKMDADMKEGRDKAESSDLKPISTATLYSVHCYMAEALCMMGKYADAITHLDNAAEISIDQEGKHFIRSVEMKFRQINVRNQDSEEKLNAKIINRLNKCVVYLCHGQFDMARRGFDEVLSQPEEAGGLGLKEITVDTASSAMLPSYLVSLLTYFYLRTKNFKMARAMIKSRRFVVDQDHISQQVRQSEVVP